MIRFYCDYSQSAHPKILKALSQIGDEQHPGYGEDEHCKRAANLIKKACAAPESDVHFLVGGTQANTTIISAILRPHQGVLSADTGHIATHETGAIEATGHKVLPLTGTDGKITAAQIADAVEAHWADEAHEHMPQPGLVYLSHPTESGTVYTLPELEAISAVCRKHRLPLMIDGARLGYGLASPYTEIRLPDLARLCDVFYIGGTKLGSLFGEAVVIQNDSIKQDFRYLIKRHGGLLAKGFLLGVQFATMFEDGLYFELGKHGVTEAMHLRQGLIDAGIPLQYDTGTNQQFPKITEALKQALSQDFTFAQWEKIDAEHSVIRFCTSWATKREDVDKLIHKIKENA